MTVTRTLPTHSQPIPPAHSQRSPDVIDQTMTLDPAALWPNPLDCPDWPMEYGTRRYEGPRGRQGAEMRLEQLKQHLNRGSGKLRAPTEDERKALFAKYFGVSGNPPPEWHSLGLAKLKPRDRTVERDARVIVDVAHVRGYLRKLDAMEARAAEGEEARKTEDARAKLDSFNRMVEKGRAELTELAEAEARHKQRIEDERAFRRCNDIRQNVRFAHHGACMAAGTLGVEGPPMPQFVD